MKNIVYLGQDEELTRRLFQLPAINDVKRMDYARLQESGLAIEHADIILISDKEVALHQLQGVVQAVGKGKEIAYLTSFNAVDIDMLDAAIVCERLGVDRFLPKRTNDQIVEEIERRYLGGDKGSHAEGGKVIAFVGTLAQAGVTSTVLSLADMIAAESANSLSIGVLGFNANNPGLLVPYSKGSLDQLYTQIQQDAVMKPAELLDAMQPIGGFHYLAGNRDLKKKYRYKTEAAQHVIQLAKQQFDLVLIDAGASPDNNLCLQALLHADLRIVLSTQQPSALLMWSQYQELFRHIFGNDRLTGFMLLLNRFRAQLGESNKFENSMQIPLLNVLPDLKDEGSTCEADKILLTSTGNGRYRERMSEIAQMLLTRFDLSHHKQANARRGWRRWGRK